MKFVKIKRGSDEMLLNVENIVCIEKAHDRFDYYIIKTNFSQGNANNAGVIELPQDQIKPIFDEIGLKI